MSQSIGEMVRGLVSIKGEPHGDMLPIYEGYRGALSALCHAEKALGFFNGLMGAIVPDRDRMLQLARKGFSATPDLSIKLIRDKGYGARPAHRICATLVRIARERGILACDATGELLDEAARVSDDPLPGLTTEEVREQLDPVKFIERHNNLGDPAPAETRRLIASRRDVLAKADQRQCGRVARLAKAADMLDNEVNAIIGEA